MEKKLLLQVKNLQISWLLDNALIPIVCGLDFSLKSGKVLALVGESGCGKSVTSLSLLRLLAKELKIVDGEILFYGQNGEETLDMVKIDPRGKDIQKIRGGAVSMIFQEPMSSFSPLYTIGDQIMEVIQLHKDTSKKEAKRITVELLMRQRAMIAKALSCNPSLLIADEPTTALDVTIQNQILNLMCDMKQEFRTSIIFITHDLGVVGQMADEVAIMYMGNIIEQGTTREIFKNPKHPYTIKLLDAVPRLGNLEARRRLETIQGNVPGLFDRPSGCAFRPRCDYFMSGICDTTFPDLREVSKEHFVACYLYRYGEIN